MARIKTKEATEEAQTVEQTEATTTTKEATEEVIKETKTEVTAESEDIPVEVAKILEHFPQYQTLYVTPSGNVYTPNTQQSIRGKAILYKNPFYKN
jgi:NADH:ubiquinone oxidoreductase subunit D